MGLSLKLKLSDTNGVNVNNIWIWVSYLFLQKGLDKNNMPYIKRYPNWHETYFTYIYPPAEQLNQSIISIIRKISDSQKLFTEHFWKWYIVCTLHVHSTDTLCKHALQYVIPLDMWCTSLLNECKALPSFMWLFCPSQ